MARFCVGMEILLVNHESASGGFPAELCEISPGFLTPASGSIQRTSQS
jgi:hypothetical protein